MTQDFDVVVGTVLDGGQVGACINEYLKLRKQIFIKDMDWDLASADDIEFEQYDTIATTYVIAHRDSEVLGGARLIRTDNQLPIRVKDAKYSYMIRDAYLGRLPGLPKELCFEAPPVDKDTWELTRFISKKDARVGVPILQASNGFLKSLGATTCLFLGPPAFMRMSKSLGYSPRALGDVVGNNSGRFLATSCEVI